MIESVTGWIRESFGAPWLLLLLPLAALVWLPWLRRRRTAVLYSSTDILLMQPATPAMRARILLPILRTVGFALLIVSLAHPRKGNELTRVLAEGIAIQMVVDRSGSMKAMDFHLEGRRVDRLAAVKDVVKSFVLGEGELPGRRDDLVGLVVFAGYADSACPMTLDHDFLVRVLKDVEIAGTRGEDGTAIGDALALGVEHLRALEESQRLAALGAAAESREAGTSSTQPARGQRIKSKVMILLTDGENNAGDIDPVKAAELAASFGIKVYTIGAGTRGTAPVAVRVFGQEIMQQMEVRIDEELLTQIADVTGGKYFRATDTESLTRIYEEIDRLEKTKTEEKRYMQYRELATDFLHVGRLPVPPLLLCAFVALALELMLASTVLRKIP